MGAKKKKKYNSRFPPARIKKIMQSDEEIGKVAAAVPVIISRSLELFVENFLKKANEITTNRGAKTITPSHIKLCVNSEARFDFLKDLVAGLPDLHGDSDDQPSASMSENLLNSHPQTSNKEASPQKRPPPVFPRQLSTPKPRGRKRKVVLPEDEPIKVRASRSSISLSPKTVPPNPEVKSKRGRKKKIKVEKFVNEVKVKNVFHKQDQLTAVTAIGGADLSDDDEPINLVQNGKTSSEKKEQFKKPLFSITVKPVVLENNSGSMVGSASPLNQFQVILPLKSTLNVIDPKSFPEIQQSQAKKSEPVPKPDHIQATEPGHTHVSKPDHIQVSKPDHVQATERDLIQVSKPDHTLVPKLDQTTVTKSDQTPIPTPPQPRFNHIPMNLVTATAVATSRAKFSRKRVQAFTNRPIPCNTAVQTPTCPLPEDSTDALESSTLQMSSSIQKLPNEPPKTQQGSWSIHGSVDEDYDN